MVKGMDEVIKGVVKDHHVPQDFREAFTQPMSYREQLFKLRGYIANRLISKGNVAGPAFLLAVGIPFGAVTVLYRYLVHGSLATMFEPLGKLRRHHYYGYQSLFNMNPDNFWDKSFSTWTSDPKYGLDVLPKRPWEDLKEPQKVMYKVRHDSTVSMRKEATGFME